MSDRLSYRIAEGGKKEVHYQKYHQECFLVGSEHNVMFCLRSKMASKNSVLSNFEKYRNRRFGFFVSFLVTAIPLNTA